MNAFHNLDAVAALIVLFSIRYQRVFVFKAYQDVLLHICGRKNGNKNWKTEYLLNLSLLMIYNEGDITAMCINTNTVYSYWYLYRLFYF